MEPAKLAIIDDDENIILPVREVFEEEKWQIIAETDSSKAFETIKNEKPDVILLDIIMPRKDGYSVFQELKSDDETKDIPVIFMTGRGDVDSIVKGLESGAVDYIAKPFHLAECMARVKTQVKLKKMEEIKLKYKYQSAIMDMAVTLGHEINNPLGAMHCFLELLENELKNGSLDSWQELTKHLHVAIERIQKICGCLIQIKDPKIVSYVGKMRMISFPESVEALNQATENISHEEKQNPAK